MSRGQLRESKKNLEHTCEGMGQSLLNILPYSGLIGKQVPPPLESAPKDLVQRGAVCSPCLGAFGSAGARPLGRERKTDSWPPRAASMRAVQPSGSFGSVSGAAEAERGLSMAAESLGGRSVMERMWNEGTKGRAKRRQSGRRAAMHDVKRTSQRGGRGDP